jgi:hypothetical protein
MERRNLWIVAGILLLVVLVALAAGLVVTAQPGSVADYFSASGAT